VRRFGSQDCEDRAVKGVALLRAINLGPKRKIPMAELRTLFDDAGCADVATYIQSGNVVFSHPSRSTAALESKLEERIAEHRGFDVDVMIRTAKEMADIIDGNPFPRKPTTELHVAFLKGKPAQAACEALDAVVPANEGHVVRNREVYLHLPKGVGVAKLPQMLSRLGTPSTVRNWRTVTTLLELTNG
jgi:uncharacterized protein (DUF1697 family)